MDGKREQDRHLALWEIQAVLQERNHILNSTKVQHFDSCAWCQENVEIINIRFPEEKLKAEFVTAGSIF